jgi:hypothetical protein
MFLILMVLVLVPAATDQMNITVNTATVASAGADQTTCGASSITLAANATTGGNWTGGAGNFAPDRNAANANLYSCRRRNWNNNNSYMECS